MKPGFIYVIGTVWGEPVKIGVAQSIASRISTLQAGNAKTLLVFWESNECDDVYAVEAHLHRHFAPLHVRGEWFSIPALQEIVDAFNEFGGRQSRTKSAQTRESVACAKAVSAMIERMVLRERTTTETAIKLLSERHGIKSTTVWALKYRAPSDMFVSDYEAIAKAIWGECGRDFGQRVFLPSADEILEAVDVLNIRSIYEPATSPSKDHRENTRAHMQRFERMMELTELLQRERLPNEPDDKDDTPRVEK